MIHENSLARPARLRWTRLRWTRLRWTRLRWTRLRWARLRCIAGLLAVQLAASQPARGAPLGGGDRVLRVCSDPNNLPFSDHEQRGFENEIARILAKELGARLEYFWWAQRRGFFRNTLHARRCDVVMGVPLGTERARTTRPYYRSSYVFVQRRGEATVSSLDDPALHRLTIGIQLIGDDADNPPPAHALSRRGIVENVKGFMVYGDYASASPEQPIVEAVARRRLDIAIVWGPLAGYYARRARPVLEIRPVAPSQDGSLAMSFEIALGVRPDADQLLEQLNRALERRAGAIQRVLDRFGVPQFTGGS
jgi:mxaJ protein